MKFSALLLLGTTVFSAFWSFSASPAITSDELNKVMRTARACPAARTLENIPFVSQE